MYSTYVLVNMQTHTYSTYVHICTGTYVLHTYIRTFVRMYVWHKCMCVHCTDTHKQSVNFDNILVSIHHIQVVWLKLRNVS